MKRIVFLTLLCLFLNCAVFAGDAEYTGAFDAQLVADKQDLDQIIFRPLKDISKVKLETPLNEGETATAGRLYHAPSDKSSILALLVESDDEAPYLYADLNLDNVLSSTERIALNHPDNNPYIYEANLNISLSSGMFKTVPLFLQYFKNVQWDEMKQGERLIQQSKKSFARGWVDIKGKKTLVQYPFNAQSKKVIVNNGTIGIDVNGDGDIEVDRFSLESAEAREETIVFHVGENYVSTKRADVEKNLILMREHPASDFKRMELSIGSEMPDFSFTDFKGKKRKLSEFRGKYVLLDFWAAWCGPCIRELSYQKLAYSRFQARGFEILGLNNDMEPEPVKEMLKRNNLMWPQATMDSVKDLEVRLRIYLFPTTLLLDPEGKVVSLNQDKKDQPSLRGRELITSLDRLLPP